MEEKKRVNGTSTTIRMYGMCIVPSVERKFLPLNEEYDGCMVIDE